MTDSKLTIKDPFSLILVNDARIAKNNHFSDNIWEMQLDAGEIGGLSIYSTLGMQALGLRITPIFSSVTENVTRLSQFHEEPLINEIYPNYLSIVTQPFKNLSSTLDYWVYDSSSVLGKVAIQNNQSTHFTGSLSFLVNLKPFIGGDQMRGEQINRNFFLKGKTKNLFPFFFMSGMTQTGNFGQSSIQGKINLSPGETYQFFWVFSFQEQENEILKIINEFEKIEFDKEVARLALTNQKDRFVIQTGNPDWDKTLLASQTAAAQLYYQAPGNERLPVLIQSRHPGKVISLADPTDSQFTEGISPLQLWYFQQASPDQNSFIKLFFDNLINQQHEDGFIPNNSNPADFHSRYHSFPILANIARTILKTINDHSIAEIYIHKLIAYIKYWLNDQSASKRPVWENPAQSLFESLPIHNLWDEKSQGIQTQWIDSPFLISLIIQEWEHIQSISQQFQLNCTELLQVNKQVETLYENLLGAWNKRLSLFPYRDAQTKKTPRGVSILKTTGSGKHEIHKELKYPQRIKLSIKTKAEYSRNITVEIDGLYEKNNITEIIKPRSIEWFLSNGVSSTKQVFDTITDIRIINLPENSSIEFSTCKFDHYDLSLFTAIGIQKLDNQYVDKMVENVLKIKFSSNFGFSLLPLIPNEKTMNPNSIDLPLNTLISFALLDHHQIDLVRNNFEQLMDVITSNLQVSKKFYKLYDAHEGTCTGEYNIINGLVPLSLFFRLIGINYWSDNQIEFFGANQLKDDVIVFYRGLKVICTKTGHKIITSGGKMLDLNQNDKHKVTIPI